MIGCVISLSGHSVREAMLNSGYRKSQYLRRNLKMQNNPKSFIARLVYPKVSLET